MTLASSQGFVTRLQSQLAQSTAECTALKAEVATAHSRAFTIASAAASTATEGAATAAPGDAFTSACILKEALVQQLRTTSGCVDQLATTIAEERASTARGTAALQDELKGGDILARVLTHQNKVLAGCTDTATSTIEMLRGQVSMLNTLRSQVVTPYGPGRVVRRRADGMYEVVLPWATVFVGEASIVGTPAYEAARNAEVKSLRKQVAAHTEAQTFQVCGGVWWCGVVL